MLDLVGKTFTKVDCDEISQDAYFETIDSAYEMSHMQDCCEYVRIVSVQGIENLVGSPIISAVEEFGKPDYYAYEDKGYGSHTFTEYILTTEKGTARILWLGESNGYYSESVYFTRVHKRI